MTNEVFHAGERAVQNKAGVRQLADRIGRSIRAAMPPAAQAFLDERRWIVVGAVDGGDRPWASLLAGPRGFAHAEDERTVRLAAVPHPGDPIDTALHPGAEVGLIALDPATRRRMRINGHVTARTPAGLVVAADQAYANCPKHIQRRDDLDAPSTTTGSTPVRADGLSDGQRDRLRRADTFFIVTAAPGAGVDASHRGGMPGFVHVDGDRLTWPDYGGNAMFNTLGNIEAWPFAALLVPDFATGAALQLTGRAAIDWDAGHAAAVSGAERLVTFDITAVVETEGLVPRLQLREYSPFNPR